MRGLLVDVLHSISVILRLELPKNESKARELMAWAFYEVFQAGWVYRMHRRDEQITIQSPISTTTTTTTSVACSACASPNVRYACGVCAAYTFCSHECSDALAEEHHAVCHVGDELVGAPLATWKSYTPLQLVEKTQGFLKKFAGGPSKGEQAKIWVLKKIYRQELQSILTALEAKLAPTTLAPNTRGQLEVLRQRVKDYLSKEA